MCRFASNLDISGAICGGSSHSTISSTSSSSSGGSSSKSSKQLPLILFVENMRRQVSTFLF